MYNFLLQEEWWMETIIAAVLTAGATLIATWIMYSSKMNKVADQVEQLKAMIDKGGDKRQAEHKELSAEHKELSGEHKELSREHRELKDGIQRVITNQESEKTARETAAKKMPEESGLVAMVKAVYKNNERLQQQNLKLNAMLVNLQKENIRLKAQTKVQQKERDDYMEIEDMDIFDSLGDELQL